MQIDLTDESNCYTFHEGGRVLAIGLPEYSARPAAGTIVNLMLGLDLIYQGEIQSTCYAGPFLNVIARATPEWLAALEQASTADARFTQAAVQVSDPPR